MVVVLPSKENWIIPRLGPWVPTTNTEVPCGVSAGEASDKIARNYRECECHGVS